ncbi:MAG TPA: hypothetical protein VGF61_13290 [Candidatus Acidoferrum sp.]|jgi:hypothetical protein
MPTPKQSCESRSPNPALLFLVSFFAFVALGGLSLWVSGHGYSDPAAVNLLNRSYDAAAGPETLLRQIAWNYPQLPILLQATASRIPAPHANLPVNLLSALCASCLVGWLYLEMCGVVGSRRAVFWTLLVAVHPFFLWAATSSLVATLALSFFLVLAVAILRIAHWADARSFLTFSFVLTLCMFNWDGGFLLFLLLLLFFPAFLPSEMRRSSIWAGYIAAFLIPVSAILCGFYMSWVFEKKLEAFSELQAGIIRTGSVAFIRSGHLYLFVILLPLLSALMVLPPLLRLKQLSAIEKRALVITLCIPSILLFTLSFRPAHPIETLALFAALPAATLIRFLREYQQVPAWGTFLLLASSLAGCALVALFPFPEMQSCLAALSGRTTASSLYEVASLVPWLVVASALFAAAVGTAVLRRPNA